MSRRVTFLWAFGVDFLPRGVDSLERWGVDRVRHANHPTMLIPQRGWKGGALHPGEVRNDKDRKPRSGLRCYVAGET